MKNKNYTYTPDNECIFDLDAAAPHPEIVQVKRKHKRVVRTYRTIFICMMAAILLCVALWRLTPAIEGAVPETTVGQSKEAATEQSTETAPSSEECQVKMVVEMNGVILQEGQTYAVEAGDEIKISAFSTEAEIQRIGYYSNVNMDIRDTFDNDAVIILPVFEEGTRIQLFIEAVATNDDGTANTITKTGWKKYILKY